jgi:hypothetical protein
LSKILQAHNKWKAESEIKEILKDSFSQPQMVDQYLELLHKNGINTLENWHKLAPKQKLIYNDEVVVTLDELSAFIFGFKMKQGDRETKYILDKAENLKLKF